MKSFSDKKHFSEMNLTRHESELVGLPVKISMSIVIGEKLT